MDSLGEELAVLMQQMEEVHPNTIEIQERDDVMLVEQLEIQQTRELKEQELLRIEERIAKEQKALEDLEAQLDVLQKEFKIRADTLQEVEVQVESAHTSFEENKQKQTAIVTELATMFEVDERIETLQAAKKADVQSIVDIHSSIQSSMQGYRLEQEETKSAAAIELLEASLEKTRKEQEEAKARLQTLLDNLALHYKREDQYMRTISKCAKATHTAAATEAEVAKELQRLLNTHQLEDYRQQIGQEEDTIESLEREMGRLEEEIEVKRKSIVATRKVLQDHLNSCWEAKVELYTTLEQYVPKTTELDKKMQGLKGMQNELSAQYTASSAAQDQALTIDTATALAQLSEEQKLMYEELDEAMVEAEQDVECKQRNYDRAQDHVELAQSDCDKHGSTGLSMILTKAKAKLEVAEDDLKLATLRMSEIQQKRLELETNAALQAQAAQVQNRTLEENEQMHTMERDLNRVQSHMTTNSTMKTDHEMMLNGFRAAVKTEEEGVKTIRGELEEGIAELHSKCARWTQACHELALRQMTLKSVRQRTTAMTARIQQLEKRLAEAGPHSKDQRRIQNETTSKLAQTRQKLNGMVQQRSKAMREVMNCNYEVYLAEVESKNNWFKLKLLTKDIHDAKEAMEVDSKQEEERAIENQERVAHITSRLEELNELDRVMPEMKKSIANCITKYPTPVATCCDKEVAIQELEEHIEITRPLLADLAIRLGDVEQEISDLIDKQNQNTVNSAMPISPSKSSDGR